MAASSIGIKIANGTYYRVLDEGARSKKKAILTTVKDGQTSVQIDLYKGSDSKLSDSQYVGSLVVEDIKPAPKGEAEIELVLGIDPQGNLNAEANDRWSGTRKSLSVSMRDLAQEKVFGDAQFATAPPFEAESGVSAEEASVLAQAEASLPEVERRPSRALLPRILGLILAALVLLAIVLLLVLRPGHAPKAQTPPVVAAAPVLPAPPVAPPPASVKPAVREGGVSYYVRWGDTLWDLSISFYRTPWLYGKIAKANSIRNPDLIFARTQIFIPDR